MASPTIHDVHPGGSRDMPFSSLDEVPESLKGIDPPVTLSQANVISEIADAMKEDGEENPWPIAIAQFKKLFRESGGKWIKKSHLSLDEQSRRARDSWYAQFLPEGQNIGSAGSYVEEVYDTHVIIEAPEGLFAYPYILGPEGVQFGEPSKVEMSFVVVKTGEVFIKDLPGKEEIKTEDEVKWVVPIIKIDSEKHLISGAVLIPGEIDSQNDRVSRDEIEKAAHGFLLKSRTLDLQHDELLDKGDARVVESWVSPIAMTLGEKDYPAGTWFMTSHIPSGEIWKLVKVGKINSYSIRGAGKRKLAQ